ncbi:hypothetical protein LO80_06830 [Candidatus Francisella endociliophora]|uniref:Calcineurin-like phosphoesterase domain-containing protein n=1 Tax=Candidatus Francisella endociliophora TaxID=653937 RepID=A0A097EQ62_9GAMM|nr:metallophosphoesterase [Francisella sp. FSC1006]AIT09705.1 hypothetical protein LO80_06830 [Francisella sp. FSC1006]
MKIFHISDLHFGYHKEEIIDSFKAFTQNNKPDLIIITGDLTHRAKKDQFKQAAEFISNLGIDIFCIPGNHDIPLYRISSRLTHPFKNYKEYVHSNLEPVFENDLIKIVGLNSVNPYSIKKGKINTQQIKKVETAFYNTDKWNILAFHHNITQIENLHKALPSAQQLANISATSPIDLICTGHLHYKCIKPLLPNIDKPVVAHAGSLSCKRTNDKTNSFFCFSITKDEFQIDEYCFNDVSFSISNYLSYWR